MSEPSPGLALPFPRGSEAWGVFDMAVVMIIAQSHLGLLCSPHLSIPYAWSISRKKEVSGVGWVRRNIVAGRMSGFAEVRRRVDQ